VVLYRLHLRRRVPPRLILDGSAGRPPARPRERQAHRPLLHSGGPAAPTAHNPTITAVAFLYTACRKPGAEPTSRSVPATPWLDARRPTWKIPGLAVFTVRHRCELKTLTTPRMFPR